MVMIMWFWNTTKSGKRIKKLLSVEFDSQPVYDEKYIKSRVETLEDKVIKKFTDSESRKENDHYLCIAAICIDSVIKLEKEFVLKSILSSVTSD